MEEILMGVLIVGGVIIIYIPSQRLKSREKTRKMARSVFWKLMVMYLVGAAMIAGGFLIGGV